MKQNLSKMMIMTALALGEPMDRVTGHLATGQVVSRTRQRRLKGESLTLKRS